MPARHTTRRILVPLDGSALGRATIPHLRALATVESEILLLRVLPETTPVRTDSGRTTPPDDRAARIERSEAQLREIADALCDITPRIEQIATIGNPADEILRVAEDRNIDLILMATHGLGTPDHPLTDSVTSRVAQAAAVPVMILSPNDDDAVPAFDDGTARYSRVVVPLDGSERARAALPIAAALARRQLRPVRLVRAMPPRDEIFPADGDTAQEEDCDRYYAAWRANLADALRTEARKRPSPELPCETAVLTGTPVHAIPDQLQPGDVLVLASHGEGGVRPWLLGTVAQQLIAAARTPVVLVPVEERRAFTAALRRQDRPARILQRRAPSGPEPIAGRSRHAS